jgi:hypothetical protein
MTAIYGAIMTLIQRLTAILFATLMLTACAGVAPPTDTGAPSATVAKPVIDGDYRIEMTYYHVTMGAQHSFLSVTKREGDEYRLVMRLHATPVKMKTNDAGRLYYDYWSGGWTEIGDCFKILPMFDDGGGLFEPPAGAHLALANEDKFLGGREIKSVPLVAGDRDTIRAALAPILAFSAEVNGAAAAYDLLGDSEANCNSYTAHVIDEMATAVIRSDEAMSSEWFPGVSYEWARLKMAETVDGTEGDAETFLIILNDTIMNPDPAEACVNTI